MIDSNESVLSDSLHFDVKDSTKFDPDIFFTLGKCTNSEEWREKNNIVDTLLVALSNLSSKQMTCDRACNRVNDN